MLNGSEFELEGEGRAGRIEDWRDGSERLRRDPLHVVLPVSVVYAAIFVTGLVGNVSTCVVIARNKSMHTATNYYLFSLAVSDLLLLVSGLPSEMYYIWSNYPYVFGEAFCVVQSFAAETSANATVLTITAFTVERYVAICHPFLSHTMSKLSRAVKFVIAIWLLALCLAIPQAIQFGVVYERLANGTLVEDTATCSVKWTFVNHAFEISTILFFVVPMTVITVLYVLIGLKLRNSRLLSAVKRNPSNHPSSQSCGRTDSTRARGCAQRNVIRMLVAVVVAFFICWAPFHAQRLLAVYAANNKKDGRKTAIVIPVYTALTYVSGVFYYLSTTINPLLYNIMSNKFREAFKAMLSKHCGRRLEKSSPCRPTYSSLSRYPRSAPNRMDPQGSASLSVSEDTQKLTPNIECSRKPLTVHLDDVLKSDESTIRTNFAKVAQKENAKKFEKNGMSLSRGSSNSSQMTAMTTLGKSFDEGNNNHQTGSFIDKMPKHRNVNLGLLANRLKLGAGELFAGQPRGSKLRMQTNAKPAESDAILAKESTYSLNRQGQTSIESTNTISNSSLQDLDETEFTGPELARYMGELNYDLVT